MNSPHLQRAILLLQQRRMDLAEQELRRALLENPHDATALSLLANCLARQDRLEDATHTARAAIVADPGNALGYYMLGVVLRQRNRFDEAAEAVGQAIRIEPDQSTHWAELAQIELNRQHWDAALQAAERGLAHDAEDVDCTNLRAMALVKLGRREEAGQTIDVALARDPDNAVSHANRGWTLLESREPRKAMEHFREALRLNPDLDWARSGIAEAMKARNPLYRWLLAYFLWMAKLSPGRAARADHRTVAADSGAGERGRKDSRSEPLPAADYNRVCRVCAGQLDWHAVGQPGAAPGPVRPACAVRR